MHGKGMALLLSPGPKKSEDSGDHEESEDSVADSVEFSEMFDAFTEAAGINPKDAESARRRLCALMSIHSADRDY